jgi:carbon-monoxide dehydrogenase medium subunit
MYMKIRDFVLHEPTSLNDACNLLAKYGKAAKVIAGGTDILPDLKRGALKVEHLVSVSKLEELKKITKNDDELWIGSAVTLNEVADSEVVKNHLLVISEAASAMASTQIRNMATIGGNIGSANSCADMPPSLIAAGAFVLVAGPDGDRKAPLDTFFLGMRRTVLKQGELIVKIAIPRLPKGSGISYKRVIPREANAPAVASVASRIDLRDDVIDDGIIVLGAVAPSTYIAKKASGLLRGKTPDEALFKRAAVAAAKESKPIDDIRGSKQYRRDLVEALTMRSLQEACLRAKEGGN